jgi:hypothetical protein
MHPGGAAVGAVVMTLMIGAAGCDRPTAADPGGIAEGGESSFVVVLVTDSAQSTYWLQPGDTITVRIRVTPEPREGHAGRTGGTLGYDGVAVWSRTREPSAAFEAGYFTHPELGERLISVFWGDNPAGARLVLIVNLDPLTLDWIVTASDAEGDLIEIASGRGTVAAS